MAQKCVDRYVPRFPDCHCRRNEHHSQGEGGLTKVAYRFRNRHGERKDNTREVYDNGNSAVVLPYDPDRGTILLTRQLRIPAFLQDGKETILEACAGKLEGEAPEQRMVKEIEEELGYRSTTSIDFSNCT
jgi:GDP-mannose pyrophosphatase NudK